MPDKPAKIGLPTGKNKRLLLIAGAVGAAGVVYYVVRQGRSATTAPTATDPSIDPATGIPYADESQGGSLAGYSGSVGDSYGGNGTPTGTSAGTVTIVTQEGPAETNLAWMHHAEQHSSHAGYTDAATAAALSAYLIGAPLTPHQVEIIEHVISIIGTPPQGAPTIHRLPAQGQKKDPPTPPVHKKQPPEKKQPHKQRYKGRGWGRHPVGN